MKFTEEGTDNLFKQYTIKEIQDIERKLRNDIEKKKEDLRQMVGERYQDLMSAADTITDMKNSADKVTHHLKVMEQRCSNIYNQTTPSGILQSSSFKAAKELGPVESVFVAGARMKILMDTPNTLWAAMESGRFVQATHLYLLSLHIGSSLNFDLAKGTDLLKKFPVITNQISQIRKFRSTILRNCRDCMKKENLSDAELADILCCLLLLDDDAVPKALFEEFLRTRLNMVDLILRLDKEDTSIKDQVCDVSSLICNTIQLVNAVFSPNGDGKSLLEETYSNVALTSVGTLIDLEMSPVFSFLPRDILDFKPKILQDPPSISSELMRETCLHWLENNVKLVRDMLRSLLLYVNSVKGLAAIRDSLDRKLNEIRDEKWDETCVNVFGQPFSPYNDVLKLIFMERIKLIWDKGLENIFSRCEIRLNEASNSLGKNNWSDLEIDLTKYIWSESPNDFSIEPGWLVSDTSNPISEGGIYLKSRGFTPKIQNLCNDLDNGVKEILEDLETFGISTRELEMSELKEHVKISTQIRVRKTLSFVTNTLKDNQLHLTLWYPFVGRFCAALTELCPNLKRCFATTSLKSKEDEEWLVIKLEILKCSNDALNEWGLEIISAELSPIMNVLRSASPITMLENALTWDEREITEETEDGKTVKSTVRIPTQASGFLQIALFNTCNVINRTIGHTLPGNVVKRLSKEILEKCLNFYKNAADDLHSQAAENPHFAQTFSLQLLFDIQYLNCVFGSVHPEFRGSVEETVGSFEALIDPFDLDVFNPILKSNLASATHRSLLLFGLLSTDRISSISAQRLGPQNQPYNLLMANSGVGRFLLLPSNTKTEKRNATEDKQKSPSQKMSRSYGSSPSLGQMAESDNVIKSSSFYDRFSAMGASWFRGNINN